MELRNLPVPLLCISILVPLAVAQGNAVSSSPAVLSASGLVIEKIASNSEAEKAGIQAGDILLNWVRGDARGQLESPFDLAFVEIEQAPLGTVKVEGLRGDGRQVWSIGPSDWGLTARPNFSGQPLSVYREAGELAQSIPAGERIDAAKRWKELAGQYSNTHAPWLPSWLLLHAAELLKNAKQWKEADEAYQSAVQFSFQATPLIQGQILRAWAGAYQQRSDWPNAEKYFQQSIAEIQKSGGGKLAIAANLSDLGRTWFLRGNLPEAERYQRQALEMREKLAPDSLSVAASLSNLGNVFLWRGELAQAEQYHRRALAIREKLAPGSVDVASSFNNLGIVASQRGELAQAEQYYREALAIRQKLAPGTLDAAANLNNLGIVTWKRGDLARADQYLRQALEIKQKLAPGGLDVASSLNNLGIVAYERGEWAQAEQYHRQALGIQEKLAPGSIDMAENLGNLGNVAKERGDLAQAEEHFRHALEIQKKLAPGSLDAAYSWTNLGVIADERGEWAQAEQYHRQALEIAERAAPGGLEVANTLGNLGRVAYEQGELTQAGQYYQRAFAINEDLAPESFGTAVIMQALGDLARKSGDSAKAEQYYRRAVAIEEKLVPGSKEHAESLAALASILRDQQQLDAAAQFYARALSALEQQTAHLGGSEEQRSGFRARHSAIYSDFIDLLVQQKQPEQAFDVLERSRAQGLLETLATAHIDIHKGVEPELLERERSLQADIAAKSNLRVELFRDKQKGEQILAVEKEIAHLLAEHQEVEETIRSSSPVYASLIQPRTLSVQEIRQHLLDSKTLLLEYSLGEKRSYVFALTAGSLDVFTLPKRSEIEALARSLYDLVTARNQIVRGETDRQADKRWREADVKSWKVAAELAQMVLRPVTPMIKNHRLVIVSDGALQYIPFAALPLPEAVSPGFTSMRRVGNSNAGFTGKPGSPLVVEHEVVNLPSASVMAELRREELDRPQPPKAVAVLADPVFDPKDQRVMSGVGGIDSGRASGAVAPSTALPESPLPPDRLTRSASEDRLTRSASDLGFSKDGQVALGRLVYTRQEADSILKVTPRGEGLEALDFRATRETAMSPALAQYRVVHFATHGLLNSEHPELSGLVFSMVDSRGRRQDGFLELEDIYNLNLPVDLVVLSGCETGLGKEIKGEGLIGLTRGFMYAGSSRVMASLWSVSDQATAELMAAFYKAMEQGKMTPPAALRAAQIKILKQDLWKAPYYWAGFQLQGEWK
jgi:CHAT domain-containing protein/Tfp pilus assembly protein PilF